MEEFKDLKLRNNEKKEDNNEKKEENRTSDIKASEIDWNRVVGLWRC